MHGWELISICTSLWCVRCSSKAARPSLLIGQAIQANRPSFLCSNSISFLCCALPCEDWFSDYSSWNFQSSKLFRSYLPRLSSWNLLPVWLTKWLLLYYYPTTPLLLSTALLSGSARVLLLLYYCSTTTQLLSTLLLLYWTTTTTLLNYYYYSTLLNYYYSTCYC